MAMEAFEQISSLLPASGDIHYIFGIWLENNGEIIGAIQQLRFALLIQENHIAARTAMTRVAGKVCDR